MEFFWAALAYVLIGLVSGVLGGMLGIGGGIIAVPSLLLVFHLLSYPQAIIMHMAIATSLAAMVFNAAAATRAQNKRGFVYWSVFKKMVPGFVIGSIVGSIITLWLSGIILEIIFGIFLCVLAGVFFFKKEVHHPIETIPSGWKLSAYSSGIGAVSILLGIGGGILVVPLLTRFRIADKKAIATASACTLVTTVLGSICYLILGWHTIPGVDMIGLIEWPAFLLVGIAAFFAAPLGVKWMHELSVIKVRKIFAVVVAATGLAMIIY